MLTFRRSTHDDTGRRRSRPGTGDRAGRSWSADEVYVALVRCGLSDEAALAAITEAERAESAGGFTDLPRRLPR